MAILFGTQSHAVKASTGGSGYSVTGAGTSAVNGIYTEAGTNDGVPYYTYSTFYMYRSTLSHLWYIGASLDVIEPEAYYRDSTTESDTPPEKLWSSFDTGDSPPPTVAAV